MNNGLRTALPLTGVFFFWLAYCGVGRAQQPQPPAATSPSGGPTQKSLDEVRTQAQAFVKAFNSGDAKAVAAFWTEDGEYVDESGQSHIGRKEIEKTYAELFGEDGAGKLSITIDSLRLLSPDAAIEDGRSVSVSASGTAPGYSKYTAVHVKRDGKWQMASVRESWVEPDSASQTVDDLKWLIGTWVAEEKGIKTESVCRWVADKRFVEREYTTTGTDGTQTSGVQLIGWNPAAGAVQSWDFSPDGGNAVGVWTPEPGGWAAQMEAVTGDGVRTTAVNHLTRLDDNAYVWQSVERTYGEQTLPDTAQVVLRRKSPSR